MRITLRPLVLTLAVLATAAFTAHTASASAATTTVRVPFNFNVNGKTLPAGDYQVMRDDEGRIVTLQSEDYKNTYSWPASRIGEPQSDPKVTLRFDADNGTYALRSVQYQRLVTGKLDKHISERATLRIVEGTGF